MGKKKDKKNQPEEPEIVEPEVEPENEAPDDNEPVQPVTGELDVSEVSETTVNAVLRVSFHEMKGTFSGNPKIMPRLKALELVMDTAWLSTNKTVDKWLWFCRVVELAPVNEMPLQDWIRLVTDGGTEAQKKRYADILKQLEV